MGKKVLVFFGAILLVLACTTIRQVNNPVLIFDNVYESNEVFVTELFLVIKERGIPAHRIQYVYELQDGTLSLSFEQFCRVHSAYVYVSK